MSDEMVPVVFDVTIREKVEFDATLCLSTGAADVTLQQKIEFDVTLCQSAEVGVTLCRRVDWDVSHFQGKPVIPQTHEVGSGGAAFVLGGPRRRRRN